MPKITGIFEEQGCTVEVRDGSSQLCGFLFSPRILELFGRAFGLSLILMEAGEQERGHRSLAIAFECARGIPEISLEKRCDGGWAAFEYEAVRCSEINLHQSRLIVDDRNGRFDDTIPRADQHDVLT
jgi:hypothetical protein